MKLILLKVILAIFCLFYIKAIKSQNLENAIFEQDCNDSIPMIFAPEIVSTQYAEFGITIMPDYPEIYFTRRGAEPNPRSGKIMLVKKINGIWQKPEIG